MITPKNIVKHELIGLEAEVVESSNKNLVGIRGKVVDETRNMLVIFDKRKNMEKRVEKKISKFMFIVSGKKVIVNGALLVARPEDRIRKKLKKW